MNKTATNDFMRKLYFNKLKNFNSNFFFSYSYILLLFVAYSSHDFIFNYKEEGVTVAM